MGSGPLSSLRVLDLSRVLAGPYCTQLLADLGADVIKIEPPGGDDTRRFGPPFVGGESTYYLSANRGKRSMIADLRREEARAVVEDLARWADVVVENFRAGTADKLGVGYAALSAINPRLVYASISGYGHRGGQHSKLPGYDLIIQGVGGISSLTGPVDGVPFKTGTSIADLGAGMFAFGAILAALYQRGEGGGGQHLDLSMLDCQLALLSYHASAWLNAGVAPRRLGNAHPNVAPYETVAAADGYFNMGVGNDAQFRALTVALGQPELAADPRFSTNPRRVQHREELLAIMRPRLAAEPVDTWIERLQAAGVPCGSVNDVPTALAHPQAAARGLIVEQAHATVGQVRNVGAPFGFPQASFAPRPPPRLGEHTDEILRDVLGYDPERIAALRASGAVPDPAAATPTG